MTPEQEHLEAERVLAAPDRLSLEEEVRWALRVPPGEPAARRPRAALWLHARRRILDARDPSFDASDLPQLELEPPAATGLPSGVAPEAIRDAALRAEYEAALEHNRRKALAYTRQIQVRDLSAHAVPALEQRLVAAYTAAPPALDELASLLDEHFVEAPARARILAAASAR